MRTCKFLTFWKLLAKLFTICDNLLNYDKLFVSFVYIYLWSNLINIFYSVGCLPDVCVLLIVREAALRTSLLAEFETKWISISPMSAPFTVTAWWHGTVWWLRPTWCPRLRPPSRWSDSGGREGERAGETGGAVMFSAFINLIFPFPALVVEKSVFWHLVLWYYWVNVRPMNQKLDCVLTLLTLLLNSLFYYFLYLQFKILFVPIEHLW